MSKEQPNNPRVVDNDRGVIVVNFNGRQIRGWSYQSDDERRKKMLMAREYVEGWCDGRDWLWHDTIAEARGMTIENFLPKPKGD